MSCHFQKFWSIIISFLNWFQNWSKFQFFYKIIWNILAGQERIGKFQWKYMIFMIEGYFSQNFQIINCVTYCRLDDFQIFRSLKFPKPKLKNDSFWLSHFEFYVYDCLKSDVWTIKDEKVGIISKLSRPVFFKKHNASWMLFKKNIYFLYPSQEI